MSLSNLEISIEPVALYGAEEPDRSSFPRYPSVSIVGGFLYFVGNMFTQYPYKSLIGVLNIGERKWRWIPYQYSNTYYISPRIFLYEDSLVMLSTKDTVGLNTRKMSRFDLVLEHWSDFDTVTTGILAGLGRRYYFSGDYLEKKKVFVVFGGEYDGEQLDDLCILHVSEKRWVQPKIKGKKPEPRYMHGSCTHKGKVYYYGGRTRERRSCKDGLHVLTLMNGNTATWSTLKQIELVVNSFALVPMGRLLVVCGGYSRGRSTGLRVYDPVTGELRDFRLQHAKVKHIGSGLAAFKTPFANTIGLIGGNARVDSYVELSVSQ